MNIRGICKGSWKLGAILILILLALGAWLFSEIRLSEGTRLTAGFSQIRLTDGPLTVAQVHNLQEEAGLNYEADRRPAYTGWTQKGSQKVENPALSRSRELAVIYCYGSTTPTLAVVSQGGCAISPEAANELFGTWDVPVGTELCIAGETYTVEQVLPPGSPEVIAKVREKSAVLLDVLDVYSRGLSRMEFSTETVIVTAGLNSRTVLEYDGLFAAAKMLRNLPLWLMLLFLAGGLLKKSFGIIRLGLGSHQETGWWKNGWPEALLGLVILAGGSVVLGAPFALPQRFVPTRWSDFSFWSAAFSDLADQISQVLSMELYAPDQQLRSQLLSLVALGWLCGGLLLLAGLLGRSLLRERGREHGSGDTEEHRERI